MEPMPELEMLTPETLAAIADPMGYAKAMFAEMAKLRRQLLEAKALAENERRAMLGRIRGTESANHFLLDQLRDQGEYVRRLVASRDQLVSGLVQIRDAWSSCSSSVASGAGGELWERKLAQVLELVGIVTPGADLQRPAMASELSERS